ncbi:MAG: FAD-dependent monooxygenase [Terrimicrobiaceae bacterium]|nr:FAD-dependent monooxygenase [Terrimicrobiaceae bacterium]
MSTRDYEVAIIGGGPCGLLTALLLARRGIRCAIFERKPEPIQHPRAMAISRRSAEILQQLGLRQAMDTTGLGPPAYSLAIWSESLTGEVYGRVPWHADGPAVAPYSGFHCPQTTTERVLLDALEREGDASIFFDHEITALADAGDHARLTVHRDGRGQTFDVTSAYVVAADGAGSSVRHWLDIKAVGPGDLGHFLNTFFRASYGAHLDGRRAVLNHILRADLFEVFVAVNGDDLWLMHHFLQPGEHPADYPPERLAELVKAASGLPGVPVEILGASPWVMSPKVAASFRKGRVFLTGDAAARLSPAAGLGMNTGLQSAHNLAWKLAAALRGAPQSLLDSYDAERRGQVMHTFETSNDFGSETWEIVNAGLAGDFTRVRDLVANSRRGGSGIGLDLGWRYERGAFIAESSPPLEPEDVDTYHPSATPGRRAPHVQIERDGLSLSTLDLFGLGFALLVAGDAAPWRAAVDPQARFAGFELELFQIGGAEGYADSDGHFQGLYGLNPGGAVLVRPDGVVGWRSRDCAPGGLARALAAILAGG